MSKQTKVDRAHCDNSSLELKNQKQRIANAGSAALAWVTDSVVSKIMSCEATVSALAALEAFYTDWAALNGKDSADWLKMRAIWSSKQNVALIAYALMQSGITGPTTIAKRVWNFRTVCGSQCAKREYLAIKAHTKAVSLGAALVSNDWGDGANANKYLATLIILFEVLNVDVIDNTKAYAMYMSNAVAIERLTANLSIELRALLTGAQLFKHASTASTQRPTSANVLQLIGACTNAGNERMIYADKESRAYKLVRELILPS